MMVAVVDWARDNPEPWTCWLIVVVADQKQLSDDSIATTMARAPCCLLLIALLALAVANGTFSFIILSPSCPGLQSRFAADCLALSLSATLRAAIYERGFCYTWHYPGASGLIWADAMDMCRTQTLLVGFQYVML